MTAPHFSPTPAAPNIIHLPRCQWAGHRLLMNITSDEYYHLQLEGSHSAFLVRFIRKTMPQGAAASPLPNAQPDALYNPWLENACAWGIVKDGVLLAAIETCPETWNNRLRITEMWVHEAHRGHGFGHSLMDVAKEQLRHERHRALVLETQSNNVGAIDFYMSQGFMLIGFDACAYTNNDIERREVRMEMGWFPDKKAPLTEDSLVIRPIRPDERHDIEALTRRAFWNKFKMGCDEHYLVHTLWHDPAYLPNLSRVAEMNGEVIGCILYTRARLETPDGPREVLTFGPLCTDPNHQGRGVGEALIKHTARLAKAAHWPGIVILGEKDYYPRVGFRLCSDYGITTSDGKNFDAFMCLELIPGSLTPGRFFEAPVYTSIDKDAVDAFDQRFPPMRKLYFPGQWA
jgi:predicted N-acetyltransferase YhbS